MFLTRLCSARRHCRFSTLKQPNLVQFGPSGILARFGVGIDQKANEAALALMRALDEQPFDGLVDLVPSYAALLIKHDCLKISSKEVMERLKKEIESIQHSPEGRGPRTVEIPVKYGGECGADLAGVASLAGLSEKEVAALHAAADYRVYFLGFMAGFPYLGGLDHRLASVPRRATPRARVEGGSVALAAGQTGVYPVASPGGWHVIGKTSRKLFDPLRQPPSLLQPGDRVKFVDVAELVDSPALSPSAEQIEAKQEVPFLEVLKPGVFATVQDLGRRACGRYGVATSGAADWLAARMGAALVGNESSQACVEVSYGQASFKALGTCHIALTGADCGAKVGERAIPMNTVCTLQNGEVLELGRAKDGARTYIHVAGGVAGPVILGSRSCDSRAGMGSVLRVGERLGRLEGGSVPPRRSVADPLRQARGGPCELRVVVGPGNPSKPEEAGAEAARLCRVLAEGRYVVSPLSDRMGVRLQWEGSEDGSRAQGGQVLSEGLVPGSIQLPPDGEPILLLAEYQATGGYSVAAVVIEADLWRVGQLRPGDKVVLRVVDEASALKALRELVGRLGDMEEVKPSRAAFNLKALTSARPQTRARVVDLNADLGEGFDDKSLIPLLSSANLACGGHVGTADTLLPVVEMAVQAGVAIGAHVSFVDPENFGRKPLKDVPPALLKAQVLWQAGSLSALCRGLGTAVRYIKPHGALYHVVMGGGPQAVAVVEAAQTLGLPLLLMPGSPYTDYTEGFAERTYDGDKLRDRSLPNALIHEPEAAGKQAVALAHRGIQSICIHGDSQNAVKIASCVREALEKDGFTICAFAPPRVGPEAYNDPRALDRFYHE